MQRQINWLPVPLNFSTRVYRSLCRSCSYGPQALSVESFREPKRAPCPRHPVWTRRPQMIVSNGLIYGLRREIAGKPLVNTLLTAQIPTADIITPAGVGQSR